MYKLTFKKRVWIVKKKLSGMPTLKICRPHNVSRMTVSKIMRKYDEFGWEGLQDHKTGRPETVLNPKMVNLILDNRKKHKYGACMIEQFLRRKGFLVSHRQIEKVLNRHGMIVPNPRKQKPRKWVRYQLPHPNDLWHTDWSYDPFTGKQLSVYIDDRTRLITSVRIFKSATTKNSIALLKTGITEYGKPKAVMTDHGPQYYANRKEADQNNTQFRKALNILSIRHRLAPVNRPQVNGKVERFFLTYKTEYTTGSYKGIKDYIKHYNEERPHMSLYYKTPKEAWEELT